MSNKFILLFFLLPVGACSLEDNTSIPDKIVGRWEWIRSTGGIAGWTITPDSVGQSTQSLHFRLNDTFSYYRADKLVQAGYYLMKKEGEEFVISYRTAGDPILFDQRTSFHGVDTHILADQCMDCYIHTYVRTR